MSNNKINKVPVLSIITVVFNGEMFIERTIRSVISQEYANFEYIIIDGDSKDSTIEIINKYKKHVDYFISEKDQGIYDAMNKGLRASRGDWVIFMNCSDIFNDTQTLNHIFNSSIINNHMLLYSDWYICDAIKGSITKKKKIASWSQGNILHQSIIYKKELHDLFGYYILTGEKFISDYFFFSLIPQKYITKVDMPISINDINGISYAYWPIKQKIAVDFILGKIDVFKLICNILLTLLKEFVKMIIKL